MPKGVYLRADVETRFLAKVKILEDGCWEWQGARNGGEYGRFALEHGKIIYAHRFSYEHFNNIFIPKGLTIDHLCKNTKCVNPAHLEVLTLKENVLRGTGVAAVHARVTHCPKGHLYDLLNTYYRPSRPGFRECRECKKERNSKWLRKLSSRWESFTSHQKAAKNLSTNAQRFFQSHKLL